MHNPSRQSFVRNICRLHWEIIFKASVNASRGRDFKSVEKVTCCFNWLVHRVSYAALLSIFVDHAFWSSINVKLCFHRQRPNIIVGIGHRSRIVSIDEHSLKAPHSIWAREWDCPRVEIKAKQGINGWIATILTYERRQNLASQLKCQYIICLPCSWILVQPWKIPITLKISLATFIDMSRYVSVIEEGINV